jgi:hypothetical protein
MHVFKAQSEDGSVEREFRVRHLQALNTPEQDRAVAFESLEAVVSHPEWSKDEGVQAAAATLRTLLDQNVEVQAPEVIAAQTALNVAVQQAIAAQQPSHTGALP